MAHPSVPRHPIQPAWHPAAMSQALMSLYSTVVSYDNPWCGCAGPLCHRVGHNYMALDHHIGSHLNKDFHCISEYGLSHWSFENKCTVFISRNDDCIFLFYLFFSFIFCSELIHVHRVSFRYVPKDLIDQKSNLFQAMAVWCWSMQVMNWTNVVHVEIKMIINCLCGIKLLV